MRRSQNALGFLAVAVSLLPPVAASAQQRLIVDRPYSLAWYQINPHVSILWATTCPGDPFWRPGESRNSGWDLRGQPTPKTGLALIRDSVIPLYLRPAARPLCTEAVEGWITVQDTTTWSGVKGAITIYPDSLVSGLAARDRTARAEIFNVYKWASIRFEIDSLSGRRQPGDTLNATVHGRFFFRDVEMPMSGPVSAWHETPGLRVLARLTMVPWHLVEVYGVSIYGIRLGLQSGGWTGIHFGVDVILTPQAAGGAPPSGG